MMLKISSAAVVIALSAFAATAQAAAPVTQVTVDGKGVFPESITSTKGGDLIIGGSATGAVYRAKKGSATATVFLDPAKTGIKSVLGVFAHDASNTLYVCSVSPRGAPPAPEQSNLHTFNLATGALIKTYPMPGGAAATCNDVALDKAGNAYVAETTGGRVMRLKKGAAALDEWSKADGLRGADGLGFIDDGQLIVNTVTTGRLFRIPMNKDGSAGAPVELTPSMKLEGPDGIRSIGGKKLLQAESRAARITELTIDGDKATMRVVKGDAASATSMTLVGATVWYNNAKFNYLMDPAMKGQDPGAFTVYSAPLK